MAKTRAFASGSAVAGFHVFCFKHFKKIKPKSGMMTK
jgi:hypothetical protein